MNEGERLIEALKFELKQQGKTYADLTEVLDLSHASVKRLFSEGNFTVARLEKVCGFLGTDLAGLIGTMEKQANRIDELTLEQEMELVKDPKLLCFAHALFNKWSFDEIIETYDISEHEGIHMMARLDKMRLIEMLPGNRCRLRISRRFGWIKAGPIQHFFEKQLQTDFFDSTFNKEDEIRLYVTSMLSRGSIDTLIAKLKKLAGEVNDLHLDDERLPKEQKKGVSLVLAFRPWETKVFSNLRRNQ